MITELNSVEAYITNIMSDYGFTVTDIESGNQIIEDNYSGVYWFGKIWAAYTPDDTPGNRSCDVTITAPDDTALATSVKEFASSGNYCLANNLPTDYIFFKSLNLTAATLASFKINIISRKVIS